VKVYSDGRKIFSQLECERIIKLYNRGQSQAAIARKLGCNVKTIGNVLKRLKVTKRPGGPKHFTEEDCRQMINMYKNNFPLDKIAAKFKCSRGTIHHILVQNGVPIRPGGYLRLTANDQRRIVDLYEKGQTQKLIAQYFQCAENTVREILCQSGIKIRTGGYLKISPDNYPMIIDLYERGDSTKTIAMRFGCNRHTIQNILNKMGIKKRSRKFRHIKKQPFTTQESPSRISLDYFTKNYWTEGTRAVDVLLLPPEIGSKVVNYVNEALRYAYDFFLRR
jgi:DNA invertase Pin-like site-specific DNA recombinase